MENRYPTPELAVIGQHQWAVLVIPSSPALVEQLAPAHDESKAMVAITRNAVTQLDPAGIDLVVQPDPHLRTEIEGSFQAWGAPDVTVAAGHDLGELVARYVLGPDMEQRIDQVRAHIGTPRAGVLTVVVADGSAGLTDRAPLALVDGAQDADHACQALAHGDVHGVAGVDKLETWLSERGVFDPAPWRELTTFVGEHEGNGALLAHDTTLGVGRYVGLIRGEQA